jgi:hypothetical protein
MATSCGMEPRWGNPTRMILKRENGQMSGKVFALGNRCPATGLG